MERRSLLPWSLLVLSIAACWTQASAAVAPLTGRLQVLVYEVEGHGVRLVLLNSTRYGFVELSFPPGVDMHQSEFVTGLYVRVQPASAVDTIKRMVQVASVEILEDPSGPKGDWGVRPDGQPYQYKSITYVLSLCGRTPKSTVQSVTQSYFESTKTQQYSLEGWFKTCSFNNVNFQQNNNIVIKVNLPCSGTSRSNYAWRSDACSWTDIHGWQEAAQDAATAQGINWRNYRFHILLIPDTPQCGFSGLGDMGCYDVCTTWIQDGAAAPSASALISTLSHELGHNMYLGHAARNGKEYLDFTSQMGVGCCDPVCYNAPQNWGLGWSKPALALDGNSLPAGTWKTVQIPEFLSTPNNFVQVIPTWTGSTQTTMFLGYKVSKGYDKGVDGPWENNQLTINNRKLALYTWTGSSAGFVAAAPMPNLLSTQLVGDMFTFPDSKLTVKTVQLTDGSATAVLCRATETNERSCGDGLDNDCDGLIDGADPDCGGSKGSCNNNGRCDAGETPVTCASDCASGNVATPVPSPKPPPPRSPPPPSPRPPFPRRSKPPPRRWKKPPPPRRTSGL